MLAGPAWPAMREPWVRWLEETLGQDVERCRPVGGGCSHRAWALDLANGGRLFAKTNQADLLPVLEAEQEGLMALAAAAGPELVVPRPLHCALAGSQALLVMEWLDLRAGGSEQVWAAAGAGLARLHRRTASEGAPVSVGRATTTSAARFRPTAGTPIGVCSSPNSDWAPS